MSDSKISALAAAAVLTGTETVPVVQDGSTVRTTVAAVRAGATDGTKLALTGGTLAGPVRGVIVALTDGATIIPDLDLANYYSVTLAGNRTLANPTNLVAGQGGSIIITQDATGSRTLAYGSNWKFAGGTDPVLTTAANAVDRLDYLVVSSTAIHASLAKDIK